MANPPSWALALVYWLHLLAAVTWAGGIASISLLVLPAMKRSVKAEDQLAFLNGMHTRLEPFAWFCLAVLIATGLFQMSVNPHYNGFLDISTQWSLAILAKYVLVAAMVVVTAIQTWEVLPAVRRTLTRREKIGEGAGAEIEEQLRVLQRREEKLLRLNFLLAILILGVTAIARAA